MSVISPDRLAILYKQAWTGVMPSLGDITQAQELIGFSFGLRFNSDGQLGAPGPINEAIARHIVGDPILSTLDMNLQEELAVAIRALDSRLASRQIKKIVPTVPRPWRSVTTNDVYQECLPGLRGRRVSHLAVVAFRHHQPRGAAEVAVGSFKVSTSDMTGVGEFDPGNGLRQCQSKGKWMEREALVLPYFAARGLI